MANQYIESKEAPTGTKAQQVAKILTILAKAKAPVPFEKLCDDAGAKYPQDVVAAMHALEMVGAVDRYSYVERGSTRARSAYKINAKVKVTK